MFVRKMKSYPKRQESSGGTHGLTAIRERRRLQARPDSTVPRRERPFSPSRAKRRVVAAAAAASRDPTDLLEEGKRERESDDRRYAPLKAKTRGPSHSPKLARPYVIKYLGAEGATRESHGTGRIHDVSSREEVPEDPAL